MGITYKNFILFSVLALFFLSGTSASRKSLRLLLSSYPNDGIEVIPDVEENKEMQELGKFAMEAANNKTSGWFMTFSKVVTAKRLTALDGYRYFLVVKAIKVEQYKYTEGNFLVYVFVNSCKRELMSWVFEATIL